MLIIIHKSTLLFLFGAFTKVRQWFSWLCRWISATRHDHWFSYKQVLNPYYHKWILFDAQINYLCLVCCSCEIWEKTNSHSEPNFPLQIEPLSFLFFAYLEQSSGAPTLSRIWTIVNRQLYLKGKTWFPRNSFPLHKPLSYKTMEEISKKHFHMFLKL